MTKKEYSGWHNYETWLVKLWIDNEEGSSSYWSDEALEHYKRADGDDEAEKCDNATNSLREALQESFEEAKPELSGFWTDLLNAAMCEVNWHEIAEHMINDMPGPWTVGVPIEDDKFKPLTTL